MYLTQMHLDVTSRRTLAALSSPAKLHGAVEAALPGPRERTLWRIDSRGGERYLLLLSEDEPDLTQAAEQFAPPGERWQTKSYEPLLRRIGDMPGLFNLVNYLVGMPEHLVICVTQGAELFRHIALRLVHPAQVAAVHIGNALLHHRAARQQVVQRDLHRFCVGADELARGRQQLFPRQKHMAVIHVIA